MYGIVLFGYRNVCKYAGYAQFGLLSMDFVHKCPIRQDQLNCNSIVIVCNESCGLQSVFPMLWHRNY